MRKWAAGGREAWERHAATHRRCGSPARVRRLQADVWHAASPVPVDRSHRRHIAVRVSNSSAPTPGLIDTKFPP